MAVQLSTAVRNARLDVIESDSGTAAVVKLRSGAQPANCAAADSGTVLCSITLPTDYFNAAASGAKTKLGTWSGVGIGGGGTIAHFRLYKSDGVTVVAQGSVGVGSGDMQVDNNVIADGQVVTVTAFTMTDANG